MRDPKETTRVRNEHLSPQNERKSSAMQKDSASSPPAALPAFFTGKNRRRNFRGPLHLLHISQQTENCCGKVPMCHVRPRNFRKRIARGAKRLHQADLLTRHTAPARTRWRLRNTDESLRLSAVVMCIKCEARQRPREPVMSTSVHATGGKSKYLQNDIVPSPPAALPAFFQRKNQRT